MEIKQIEEKDFQEILSLIRKEFPYVAISVEKIKERLESKRIFVFKAVESGELLGFVEAEILEEDIARINGLTVKPEHRKKGAATALLEKMLEFLEEKGIKRVMLLVKQSNDEAKKLYSQKGFRFMGLYQREIDRAMVEEMELDISEKGETPSYVS